MKDRIDEIKKRIHNELSINAEKALNEDRGTNYLEVIKDYYGNLNEAYEVCMIHSNFENDVLDYVLDEDGFWCYKGNPIGKFVFGDWYMADNAFKRDITITLTKTVKYIKVSTRL